MHRVLFPTCTLGAILLASLVATGSQSFQPEIPRTWDDDETARFELPLAVPEFSPKHVPSSYYYALPVRPIFKSYPVYHPAHEPDGYLDELARMDPQITFDAELLETEEDWIEAGRVVFESPLTFSPIAMDRDDVRDPDWYRTVGVPITSDGVMPFARYVVREKEKVELGQVGCSTCHVRVLDDGSSITGGPGNFNFDLSIAHLARKQPALLAFLPTLFDSLVHVP